MIEPARLHARLASLFGSIMPRKHTMPGITRLIDALSRELFRARAEAA